MSSLNRFDALNSDDEDEAPKKQQQQQKQQAAPAPAPKKRTDNRNGRGRGRGRDRDGRGRGRGRGAAGRDNRGPRDNNRGGRGREYDPKDDRRDHRRRDDRDRRDHREGDNRHTRQPRNGESARRQGRDPKKAGHGSIGTNAEVAAAGVAEVLGETVTNEEGEVVPAVEPEPEETGLTVAEYNAKVRGCVCVCVRVCVLIPTRYLFCGYPIVGDLVLLSLTMSAFFFQVLAEKRAALAALTGAPKAVRQVEALDLAKAVVRESEGVVKTYGASKKGGLSKKKKKGFVSADKFFATKAREENRSEGRGRGYGDRDGRGRGRGDDRRNDDRRNDRRNDRREGSSRGAKINIDDESAFPTLG